MRYTFALSALLIGCIAQPHRGEEDPIAKDGAMPRLGTSPRVGIEHVDGVDRTSSLPIVEAIRPTNPDRGAIAMGADRVRPAALPPGARADLPEERVEVRLALTFIGAVMGEDRRRVDRELGTPILEPRVVDTSSPGIALPSEIAWREETDAWISEHGHRLLNRPLRRMLRETPIVRQLEVDLDDFKSEHVPLSGPYSEAHGQGGDLGRISMRVHLGDLRDPVGIAYMKGGFRVSSSQEHLKLAVQGRIADTIGWEIHSRRPYGAGNWKARADLVWTIDPRNSLHIVAGDDMDFLSTSAIYSVFDSPMDGSKGIVLYALHLF
ncbi:MAG: hypothetical protein Fur0037_08290 [Planctomycetota bacterium]